MVAHLGAGGRRLRVAVVCGSDSSTLEAVERALREGFAEVVFVGRVPEVQAVEALRPYAASVRYREAADDADAACKAVELVREGGADILMKGLINTDVLLRAVLNKERGILPKGRVLTHLAVAQLPGNDRLLFFTDAAVLPYPTQEQRCEQVAAAVRLCHAFGIGEPRVALVHCSEKASDKFPHTLGYREIIERAACGEWGRAVVDGPLDVRTAIDPVALQRKGIVSPLEGRSDVLVFPDIEAANVFYKTLTFLVEADVAGMLVGPVCPVVLPSRGDSGEDKYYSLAFAAMAVCR